MKKKVVIRAVLICAVVLAVSGGILYHKSREITDPLSKTLNQVVLESYINYGDIEASEYKDIISSHDYDLLYYIRESYERTELDIITSYYEYPVTHLNSINSATSTFLTIDEYVRPGEDHFAGAICHYTVEWHLDDDGIWRIVDVSFPP